MAQPIWSPEDPHRWATLPLPRGGLWVHLQPDLQPEEAPGHPPIRQSPTLQSLRERIQKSFNHKSFRVWAQPEAHAKLQTLSPVMTALVNYKPYMRLGTAIIYKGSLDPLLSFGVSLPQVIIGRPWPYKLRGKAEMSIIWWSEVLQTPMMCRKLNYKISILHWLDHTLHIVLPTLQRCAPVRIVYRSSPHNTAL